MHLWDGIIETDKRRGGEEERGGEKGEKRTLSGPHPSLS